MKRAPGSVCCGLVAAVMMTLWAMGVTPVRCENAAVEQESAHASSQEPTWVVDPAAPGPDTPPAGVSLFDEVTLLPDGRREVPFPFDQLIQRFEAAAGCDATALCVRSVLLPLGRSLQRVAASPDYFRFPRIVAGVVGDGRGSWLLRDRLYVGYQERADIVEVISYNETAARFEFQQIKNYRAGARPQVFQARRTVCLACHQNHAPIFPRQVWDETNANPMLAAKLGAERQAYFGVTSRGSTDIANALDDATDRSNRLALLQRLWREGCGDGDPGSKCRSAAFIAALQFVLTERRAYDDGRSSVFGTDCSEALQRNSRLRWPGGLAMPNPDLPNRDPLAASRSSDPLAAAHVSAQLDPLLPRLPLEVLPADGPRLATLLVTGIADSLPTAEADKLSAVLTARAVKSPSQRRTHRGRCEVRTTAAITRFDCTGGVELRGNLTGSFATVDSLRVGAGGVIRNLRLPARRSAQTLSIMPKIRERALRLPDGNAITEISLDSQSGVTLTVIEDFKALQPAVTEALASTPHASHATRLAAVVAALKGERIATPSHVESAAVVEAVTTSQDAIALTAPFESRCGSCHHTADVSPPNFLSGNALRVKQALKSCAPRIFVRLAMNDLPRSQRQKTPMPPERFMAQGHDATDVRLLRMQVESLLKAEYGRLPPPDELLRNGYESLRPCLPEGLRDGLSESQP